MALSFSEKRAATKAINDHVARINGGGLTFSQKRESTKIINENVALLNGGNVATSAAITPIKTNVELDKESVIEQFPQLARAGISQIFIDQNGEVNVTSDYDFYKNGGDDQAIIKAFNAGLIKEKQIDVNFEITKHIDMLNAVIRGDYDNEDSEALLNRIETAANSLDSAKHDNLISQAMDKWLELDNKVYMLDSVMSDLENLGFSFFG